MVIAHRKCVRKPLIWLSRLMSFSVKMFKSRLTLWELDKHNRASDMAFMYRKKKQRDAQGKRSTFVARRRKIPGSEVDRYVERKRAHGTQFEEAPADAPTPLHVLCFSAPPSPGPEVTRENPVNLDEDNALPFDVGANHTSLGKRRRSKSPSLDPRSNLVSQQAHRLIRARTRSPSIPIVVRLPDVLQEHEMLFAAISTYVTGSFSNKLWLVDENAQIHSVRGFTVHPVDFFNLCDEAVLGFERLEAVQGRRVLSKALSLLPILLREEHPEFLEKLVDTCLSLTQSGFVDIRAIIQDHVAQLAQAVLPERHTLRHICISLSLPDLRHPENMERSWRCLVDSFGLATGKFSGVCVMVEANFIRGMYSMTEHLRAEQLLGELLTEYERTTAELDESTLYIVDALAASIHTQGRFAEAEVLMKDYLLRARMCGSLGSNREPELLESLAWVQYSQGKHNLAEANMRYAIATLIELHGEAYSSVLASYNQLRGWLHDWGRVEEAEEMRQKIEEIIGPDDIDVEC